MLTAPARLPQALQERILTRLGFAEPPEATLDGLRAIYAAWCHRVPFDNVQKLIHLHTQTPGALPGDDPQEFFENWLTYGTGATCWAGNGALQALLVALGFTAQRGVGTMLVAPDLPPNHGTVLVHYDGQPYVVDASILHAEPLPLKVDQATAIVHPAWGVQCGTRAAQWHIRWRPLHEPDGLDCRIEHLSVSRETFHDYHERTRVWSPFNYELYARTVRGESVIGIAFGQYVVLESTGGVSRTPLQGEERIRVLVDEVGIREDMVHRLPPDTPTPPPPGSKTAGNRS